VNGNVKENTMRLPVRATIVILLLFSGLLGVFAQETIAVHPLSDETGTPMSVIFLEELIKAIPNVPDYTGVYRPFSIDLVNNRPADVPPGGFPPYICPSPSITADAAYAITGEVGVSKDNPGEYWVRIYLWQMDKGRLIASDMVNASDRASCAESYPYVLGYLYSIIDESKQIAVQPPSQEQDTSLPQEIPVQQQPEQIQAVYRPSSKKPAPAQQWLNLGLHAGGGNSTWKEGDAFSGCVNANAAFQIGVNVIPQLTIQTEANMNIHFDIDSFDRNFWHMNVPLLFRFNLRNEPVKASIYLGPYLFFPMPWSETPYADVDFYKLIGMSYGVSAGWKFGPGYLFIDGRFNHLLFLADGGIHYPSNATVFGIGYEIELIKKKIRQ
jgi:hypothetical protein